MHRLAYIRVSTEEQTKNERTSLDDQRQAIQEATDGPVHKWFRDDGNSGRTAEGRPGFMALIEYCQQHLRSNKDGEVWILNSSRFGRFRNIDEFGYWRFKLERHGYRLRTVEEGESGDDVADAVIRTVYSAEASAYSKRLSANTRRGKRGSAKLGFWQCEAPFGYRRQEIRDGVRGRQLARGERKADNARAVLMPGPERASRLPFVKRLLDTLMAAPRSADSLRSSANGILSGSGPSNQYAGCLPTRCTSENRLRVMVPWFATMPTHRSSTRIRGTVHKTVSSKTNSAHAPWLVSILWLVWLHVPSVDTTTVVVVVRGVPTMIPTDTDITFVPVRSSANHLAPSPFQPLVSASWNDV